MRRQIAVAAVTVAGLLLQAAGAGAQSALLNLPDISQHARVTQRIGITDITIDYHRPSVRGRKIFGGLQAYGEVWRAGADNNTTIEFSDPVTIEGQPVPKGVYGLHFIPGETSWVVILSRNSTSWGSFTYDQAEDALRVNVKPRPIENHETLSYDFDDPQPSSTVATMRWEKVAVPFNVGVNTPVIVAQSLRNQIRGRAQSEWRAWEEVANYLLENKLDAQEAMNDANRSIGIEDRFENEITKARALRALNRNDEALAAQTRAIGMGSHQQVYSFGRELQRLGQQDLALEIFRNDMAKAPQSWITHVEASRVAVAGGDYNAAMKEMKLAIAVAPPTVKPDLEDLVRQLENRVDVNK